VVIETGRESKAAVKGGNIYDLIISETLSGDIFASCFLGRGCSVLSVLGEVRAKFFPLGVDRDRWRTTVLYSLGHTAAKCFAIEN
jgi:hypothetical protein